VSSWVAYWKIQLAQAVALSGGWAWGASAFAAAWLGCGLAVNGPRLVPEESRLEGQRFIVGLALGAAALATIPDLPWWVGLAWFGWLMAECGPACRLLGVWWLVLTMMTPLYHPYARLWLPLHASGWILMAGLVVRLGPFSEATPSPGSPRLIRSRERYQLAAAAVCLLLARWHWAGQPPHPFPWRLVSRPTDSLEAAVASCLKRPEVVSGAAPRLRVLARRPVVFYLALGGSTPFRILPDSAELLAGPGSSGEWALVDEVQLGGSVAEGPDREAIARHWRRVASWDVPLDPVTLLDVDPSAAFAGQHAGADIPALVLLAPVSAPSGPTP
jgi:hypothetical protein